MLQQPCAFDHVARNSRGHAGSDDAATRANYAGGSCSSHAGARVNSTGETQVGPTGWKPVLLLQRMFFVVALLFRWNDRHTLPQKMRGGDEREMSERLRKISQLPFRTRAVLLREQTEIVAQSEQSLE